jgi:hypothetical protein
LRGRRVRVLWEGVTSGLSTGTALHIVKLCRSMGVSPITSALYSLSLIYSAEVKDKVWKVEITVYLRSFMDNEFECQ